MQGTEEIQVQGGNQPQQSSSSHEQTNQLRVVYYLTPNTRQLFSVDYPTLWPSMSCKANSVQDVKKALSQYSDAPKTFKLLFKVGIKWIWDKELTGDILPEGDIRVIVIPEGNGVSIFFRLGIAMGAVGVVVVVFVLTWGLNELFPGIVDFVSYYGAAALTLAALLAIGVAAFRYPLVSVALGVGNSLACRFRQRFGTQTGYESLGNGSELLPV